MQWMPDPNRGGVMSQDKLYMHYVCTPEEGKKLIEGEEQFWISNCGCREGGEGCTQSRTDTCLMFAYNGGSSGSRFNKILIKWLL